MDKDGEAVAKGRIVEASGHERVLGRPFLIIEQFRKPVVIQCSSHCKPGKGGGVGTLVQNSQLSLKIFLHF